MSSDLYLGQWGRHRSTRRDQEARRRQKYMPPSGGHDDSEREQPRGGLARQCLAAGKPARRDDRFAAAERLEVSPQRGTAESGYGGTATGPWHEHRGSLLRQHTRRGAAGHFPVTARQDQLE